jgi:hypothetical protein
MSAGVPSVNCTHCGKNLTTDDLRRVDCRHCGTVLPHHARAQQQIAVVQGMLADRNGNGIPDAYEPLVMNAQANAMNQVFGAGYAPPMVGAPPMMGGNPYAAAHVAQANAMNHATKSVGIAMIAVVIGIVLVVLVMVGAGVAFALLAR